MRLVPLIVVVCALGTPRWALADGKRDLEDGVAFYENLDTDRAFERLTAATNAPDLGPADKAKAFLYLGMLQFELGNTADAKKSWTEALKLDRDVVAPEGTSPKTIQAIEEVRSGMPDAPGGPKAQPPPPVEEPPPPIEPPEEATPPIDVAPPPPPPSEGAIVAPPPPPPEGGSNTWLWVGIGAGAAAVVAAVVVVAVVFAGGGSGSECEMGGGGCLEVSFR